MKPPARNKVLLGAFCPGQVSAATHTRFSMGIAKPFISTHLLICLMGLLGSVSWAGDDNTARSGMVLNAAQTPALFPRELTGNWGGLRAQLLQRGVSLGLESTHFYQGSVSGDRNQDFDWGGRVDVFLNLDAAKLGLWEGGGIRTHGELKYGQLLANRGGAFLPGNTGMMLPVADLEEFVFSSIYLTQQFGDKATLMLGKINAVDLLAGDAFLGGWGNTRFMNLAFAAPLTGITPPVLMGAILSVRTDPFTFTFMVYDTEDRTLDYLPGDLFGNGVTSQLGVKWNGSMLERRTSMGLSGTYSTKEGVNLSEVLLPSDLQTTTQKGSFNVALDASHYVYEESGGAGRGVGLFFKGAIADGNPNPVQRSVVMGILANGMVPGREKDTVGLGYYFYEFSDDLQSAVAPLIKIDDEEGFEIFYRMEVTPWCSVSADLQIVNPATATRDSFVALGLRINIRF